MKTTPAPTAEDTTRDNDIKAIEMQIKYLEGEFDRLAFPIAARICSLIHFAMIEQMIHETKQPSQR